MRKNKLVEGCKAVDSTKMKPMYYGFDEIKSKHKMAQLLAFCEKNEEVKEELKNSLLVWESDDEDDDEVPVVYDVHLKKWFRTDLDIYFGKMYVVPKEYLRQLEASDLYLYLTSDVHILGYCEILRRMLAFAKEEGIEIDEWQKAFSKL